MHPRQRNQGRPSFVGRHNFGGSGAFIKKIFGDPDVGSDTAESGRAEFLTACIDDGFVLASTEHIPHWCEQRLTGVMSHVAIHRKTGAADPEKLFFEEFVPRGVPFAVEIIATRLAEDDIRFLLAVLDQGWRHPTHPYQLGANGADGWGRVRWSLDKVACLKKTGITLAALSQPILPATLPEVQPIGAEELVCRDVPHVAVELTLAFQGPFLVNDVRRPNRRTPPRTTTPTLHRFDNRMEPYGCRRRRSVRVRQRGRFLLGTLNASAAGGAMGSSAEKPGDSSIDRLSARRNGRRG